jgi:hypothetical protein
MKKRSAISVGTLTLLLGLSVAVFAADDVQERILHDLQEFDQRIQRVVARLDTDVATDRGLAPVFAELMRNEYGTSQAELGWALDEKISWGRIAILAYVQATTGRSFQTLASDGADVDVAGFVATAEMSPDKMIGSLEGFLKLAERERNSMIFDRLRTARRMQVLPDLGSGFGLFQEALDFRRLEPPRPTKIHGGTTGLAKGGKKGNK